MSFDIYFLARQPGESWQDAMDALEEAVDDDRPLAGSELAQWNRIAADVTALLPDATTFVGANHRELSDDATGIQVSLSPGELSLTVPYWSSGDEAEHIVGLLRRVTQAIETVTGLTGYDPQADAPFLGEGETTAAQTFTDTHDRFHGETGDDEPVSLPTDAAPAEAASADTAPAAAPLGPPAADAPPARKGWRRFFDF